LEGGSTALVTDAGTPGLSDPGYHLVDACVEKGIEVVPVPGANALGAALSVSGMPLNRFLFEGFLPSRAGARRNRLAQIGAAGVPFIIFESPRRIIETLHDVVQILGNREVLLAREMTKVHEEFLRGKAADVSGRLELSPVVGEITVVVAGDKSPGINLNILEASKRLLREGIPPSRAAGILADLTGVERRTIYRIITGLKQEGDQGGNDG
jgi:16S rRNA (cytidine1402-2'-O)-methyltransferase